jgi:hypothetical protein
MKKINTVFRISAILFLLMAATSSYAASFSITPTGDITFNTQAGVQTTQMITVNNLTAFSIVVSLSTNASSLFGISSLPVITIPAYGSSNVTLTYTPTLSGIDTGKLTVVSDAGDSLTTKLIGTATAATSKLQILPAGNIVFNTAPGMTGTQTISIKNTSNAPLPVTLSLSGSSLFQISGATALTVAANGTTNVTLNYMPNAAGTDSAKLTVRSALGDSATATLTGHSALGPLQLIPNGTIVFNTQAGVTATKTISVRNLSVNPIYVTLSTNGSGLFHIGGSSTFTILANDSSQITLTYSPTIAGTDSATLVVRSISGDSVTAKLVGHSNTQHNGFVTVADEVEFNTMFGQTQCLPVTIRNSSAGIVSLSNIHISGDSNQFSLSNSGGMQIGPISTGTITVCYHPLTDNSHAHAMLTFTYTGADSLLNGTATVELEGATGIHSNPGDSLFFMITHNLEFNNVLTGTSSCQAVTITNPTSQVVVIDSATISGTGASAFTVNGGSMLTVAPNSTQYINVCFNPTVATNSANATLDLHYSTNGLNGNLFVSLMGNTLDTTHGEFSNCIKVRHQHGVLGPIARGGMISDAIYLTNRTNSNVTISGATLSGNDTGAFSVGMAQFPITLQANQTGSLMVTFNPTGVSGSPSYGATINLTATGTEMDCGPISIHVEGVAVPHGRDTTHGDLHTGLTANGTNVIAMATNPNLPCIKDTVIFDNTTPSTITVNNIVIPANSNFQLISTNPPFPAAVNAGSSISAVIQFCDDPPASTMPTSPLYVATNESITPLTFQLQGVVEAAAAVAQGYALSTVGVSVSPNPASNDISINVKLDNAGPVEILLYDATGRVIETIFNGRKEAGSFTQHFDVNSLSTGAYVIAVKTEGSVVHSKLDVVK